MSSHSFQITDGKFGLALVDTAAPGYSADWQAPGGKDLATAVIADYVSGGLGDFTCQVTSGALSSSANTTPDTIPATMCAPEETVTRVGTSSFAVDVVFLQDPDLMNGLNRFLFENDAKEAFFYLGLSNDDPPKAIGRCTLVAGTIGGDVRTSLTATLSLTCSRKPDAAFGNAAASVVIEGGGGAAAIAATGVGAGTPGTSWTPAGATAPTNLAGMSAVTASPATAWTTGQYVVLGDATHAYWTGSAWAAGEAP